MLSSKEKGDDFVETITLTIRISPDLKQSLELLAKKDDRSMNNLINIILKDYIKRNTPDKEDNA